MKCHPLDDLNQLKTYFNLVTKLVVNERNFTGHDEGRDDQGFVQKSVEYLKKIKSINQSIIRLIHVLFISHAMMSGKRRGAGRMTTN